MTIQSFRNYVKKMTHYEEALGVLHWDLRTGAPRKGMEGRSEAIGTLSAELFHMQTSEEMEQFIATLSEPEQFAALSVQDQKLVEECRKEFERNRKIPADRYEQYVVLTAQSESIWEEAKEQSDYALLQPYLEEIVAFNKEFIELWGVKETPYDTLLDLYEPGMTVAKLDDVFSQLREHVVPLVQQIAQSEVRLETDFLQQPFDEVKQREFSAYILAEMGFDFEAGRLDLSAHPFAIGLSPQDVRMTTNFLPDDFTFSLFSSLHEGGHALYEQNISPDLVGTVLCTGVSMGIHESQSRLWENMIGRSLPFWQHYLPQLQQYFPQQLEGVTVESFYRAINEVKPSLIRIEADEVTYNLHIMIRYELEKALFNGELTVQDLPEAWNEQYRSALGIIPANDREGVLQDVHWAAGLFGYFPSYALGNMYAAQMLKAMERDLPNLEQQIGRGELLPIKQWLGEKVHVHGKLLTPAEIIESSTGEALNPEYLIKYFEAKYRGIAAV